MESTLRSVEKFAVHAFSKLREGRSSRIGGARPGGDHVRLTVDRQPTHRNRLGGDPKTTSNLLSEIRGSKSGSRDYEGSSTAVGTPDDPRCELDTIQENRRGPVVRALAPAGASFTALS